MQAILDHIDTVVRPALRNYSAAEATFTAGQNDGAGVDEALNQVMLTARQAANELHHLADFVFNKRALKGRQTRRPPLLPFAVATLPQIPSAPFGRVHRR